MKDILGIGTGMSLALFQSVFVGMLEKDNYWFSLKSDPLRDPAHDAPAREGELE